MTIGDQRQRARSTSRCERAREWASLRQDGELSEFERLLLRRHLGRCGECRAFAASLDAATTVLRSAPAQRPSRPVELPARSASARSARREAGVRPRVVVALVAVAAAAGVVVGIVATGDESPTRLPDDKTIAVLTETEPPAPPPPPDEPRPA